MTEQIKWTTFQILEATRGELLSGDKKRSFAGICIDSRKISARDLFVAIKGNIYDGHNFINDVIRSGVRGLIISKDQSKDWPFNRSKEKEIFVVGVSDTTKALGDLAAYVRSRSKASVVAITGSNGKTTTREMIKEIIKPSFNTLTPCGNYNNEIGLPLTLFKLNNTHQWAVLELGMNKPGEINRLAEICAPDIGVITNIGPAHLEGVGSIEGVKHAKQELLNHINPEGTVILNADDPRVFNLSKKTSRDVIFYGLSKIAGIRARNIKSKGINMSFNLILLKEKTTINLKTPGLFMVSNALAAAAVGFVIGLPARKIKDGLENFQPVPGRMNILRTRRGINIIDDTYNANPQSMQAAIVTLKSLKCGGRGVLAIGDMLELGEKAESMHQETGSLAAKSGLARLYVTGRFADKIAQGAFKEGMDLKDIFIGTREEIIKDLIMWLCPGDWVLVKGSRTMGMEKIVREIKKSGNRD